MWSSSGARAAMRTTKRFVKDTKRSPTESTADEIIDMLPVRYPTVNFAATPMSEQAIATWIARSSRCGWAGGNDGCDDTSV